MPGTGAWHSAAARPATGAGAAREPCGGRPELALRLPSPAPRSASLPGPDESTPVGPRRC
eukprot:1587344-Lingulodinium_polyedra.AAC.1